MKNSFLPSKSVVESTLCMKHCANGVSEWMLYCLYSGEVPGLVREAGM